MKKMKVLLTTMVMLLVSVFSYMTCFAAAPFYRADMIIPRTGDTMKPFIFLGIGVIALLAVAACIVIPAINKKKNKEASEDIVVTQEDVREQPDDSDSSQDDSDNN